jgi:hypothetical protein
MNTDELLSGYERCGRIAWWGQDWEKQSLEAKEFLEQGIYAGLTSERNDFGQTSGDRCVELIHDHEISNRTADQYSSAMHLAAMSDLISVAVRQPDGPRWQWAEPASLGGGYLWRSDVFLAPSGSLRRVVLASNWSEDKHFSVCRSWSSLGPVCVYGQPMQIAVVITGSFKDGKYRSYWTRGLTHPINRTIKFRKKNDTETPFKQSWTECWREDRDDIDTVDWYKAMMADGVIKDLAFKIDLPVPNKEARQHVLDLAVQKLDAIHNLSELPQQNLSVCDVPPCKFRNNCHSGAEPSGRFGFVRIS